MFTDQAYSYIFLAEDEARMLLSGTVEPEHLLLALARGGNGAALLTTRGVTGGLVQSALVASHGVGDDLVLGAVPRSEAMERALERAVTAAADRGVLAASSEHLLLGLAGDLGVAALLSDLGIADVARLVDTVYPARGAPVPLAKVAMLALRVARSRELPARPALIPPVFERYTVQARASISAAVSAAAALKHGVVSPFHFLIGILAVGENVAAASLQSYGVTYEQVTRAAKIVGPGPSTEATGLFDDEAHDTVARGALRQAYRRLDPHIATAHLLVATVDSKDSMTARLLGSSAVAEHVARDCLTRLPGEERP